MNRITKYETRDYPNNLWKHQVKVYLKDFSTEEMYTFLKINTSDVKDSNGYMPGFYISDSLMKWLRDNFGNGSNGRLIGDLFYQGCGVPDINWWIDWSYSHNYSVFYITGYFKNSQDAMLFKLRWS